MKTISVKATYQYEFDFKVVVSSTVRGELRSWLHSRGLEGAVKKFCIYMETFLCGHRALKCMIKLFLPTLVYRIDVHTRLLTCPFISGKVCLLTSIEDKRQTLRKLFMFTCTFHKVIVYDQNCPEISKFLYWPRLTWLHIIPV